MKIPSTSTPRDFRKSPFMIAIRILTTTGLYLTFIALVLLSVESYETVVFNEKSQYAILEAKAEEYVKRYEDLKSEDQYLINQDLSAEINNIKSTYATASATYENLIKLKEIAKDTSTFDKTFAGTISLLSDRNWTSAAATLDTLNKDIEKERAKIVASFVIPEDVPSSNTPPGAGYSRQSVNSEVGTFMVSMIAGDLSSTRVIVDTASDGTCANDCPVLSLGDYVSRSGAYAGINGSYFCPATYPSCAGKTNSFDTLLMNKNKTYFNSDNNVYSTVPAVIFGGGWVRFVGQSLEWGRDTGIDSMIANHPLLLMGNNVMFGGDADPKKGSKGPRSFVANRGNTVYIGVVFNATVVESAYALKALGMENALNLDSGGSTALWSGGYKVGPGRNIPNAILFVRK